MRAMQALAVLLALFPLQLQAQQLADDGGGTIIVEGQRLTRKEVRARANGFVRTLAVTQGDRGVARWVDGICPAVRGIAPEIGKLVEDKVRKIATGIGAPLSRQGCTANMLIIFAEDGRDLARQVSSRKPHSMAQLHGPERRDVEEGEAPIRWWYTIGTSGSTGGPASGTAPSASYGGNSEGRASALPDGVPTVNGFSSSLIRPGGIRTIDAATIVIDANRAEGISLTAAAAYAAFVGMAEIRGRAVPPVSSILNIFGEGASASDLSFWDTQFLDELYDVPLNRWGRVQRGYLVRAIGQADGDGSGSEDSATVEP